MDLPPGVAFRFSGSLDGEGEDEDRTIGFHLQYEVEGALVNVVTIATDQDDPQTPEDALIRKLNDASCYSPGEDEEEIDQEVDRISSEIEEWMLQQCATTLAQLGKTVSSDGEDTPTRTIHDELNSAVINLQVATVDGKPTAVIRHHGEPPWPSHMELGSHQGTKVVLNKHQDLSSYTAADVLIIENTSVKRVTVGHGVETLRCKLNRFADSTVHEHDTLIRIHEAGIGHLRIPSFRGYVDDTDGSACVGLLLQDVSTKYATLDEALSQSPSSERRAKWARQLQEVVRELNDRGIVWGDAKPANVLIDTDDDAWVLDFGGGFTAPWKDMHDFNSVESDQHALKLMVEFIQTGVEPPLKDMYLRGRDEEDESNVLEQEPESDLESDEELKNSKKRKRGSVDGQEVSKRS